MRYLLRVLAAPCLAVFLLGIGSAGPAWGGGGPENVLLVVNPSSPASMAIANHYVRLRQIPTGNIFYLPWEVERDTTDVETFRKEILRPVLEAAFTRRPLGQIDYIAYSCDFPWAIHLEDDLKKFDAAFRKSGESAKGKTLLWADPPCKPVGSLNGLTYLWEAVLTGHPEYLDLESNFYMRRAAEGDEGSTTRAFRATDHYNRQREISASEGRRYVLATMLGVTAGRGNTPAEILHYLRRSAAADGTHPAGTIYYVKNSDIRSKVRHDGFPAAVRELKALGVAAEVLDGVMPMRKSDVQGAMLGTAGFQWKDSLSTILPGAICEHFTSFGGILSKGAGQTPLSEFLRYGAAGASGTVTEPYAIAAKFPSPSLQVHYARGCTLAEAFYQSVLGPYQLLIVGDPLCRPWANIPRVRVSGAAPGATVHGPLRLTPEASMDGEARVDRFELYVDSLRAMECRPGGALDIDTTRLADGWHELRVVALEAGPIRSQGRQILWIQTANYERSIEATISSAGAVSLGQTLTLEVKAPGCVAVGALQGTRLVGKISGEQGRLEIPASKLGTGPVRLQVIGFGSGGVKNNVVGKPLDVTIEP